MLAAERSAAEEGPLKHRRRLIGRPLFWIALATGLVIVAALVLRTGVGQAPPPPTAASPLSSPRLVARGQVQPVSQAKIGTLAGGVVAQLAVEVGETVECQQTVARVRGASGTELLSAPWHGTITALLVHTGDTSRRDRPSRPSPI